MKALVVVAAALALLSPAHTKERLSRHQAEIVQFAAGLKGWIGQPMVDLVLFWGRPDLTEYGSFLAYQTDFGTFRSDVGRVRGPGCRVLFEIDESRTVSGVSFEEGSVGVCFRKFGYLAAGGLDDEVWSVHDPIGHDSKAVKAFGRYIAKVEAFRDFLTECEGDAEVDCGNTEAVRLEISQLYREYIRLRESDGICRPKLERYEDGSYGSCTKVHNPPKEIGV